MIQSGEEKTIAEIHKWKFKKEQMFKQNVINIIWLIVACLIITVSCKEKRYELTDIKKMPVAIKFTIPDSIVINSKASSEQAPEIRLRVQERYPEVCNLCLLTYNKVSGINYYEYVGERKEKKVAIFVFDESGDVAIDGFESVKYLGRESRYESQNNGLNIYKRFVVNGQVGVTVSIFYQRDTKQVSFCHDDRLSVW